MHHCSGSWQALPTFKTPNLSGKPRLSKFNFITFNLPQHVTMGATSGLALKSLQWFIRGVQCLCAALILGVYSYFLAALHNHRLPIDTSVRAVEGISGAAVLYTLIGLVFLCCVAGIAFTSFIAIVLDVCFVGAFIYVAVANKGGASSCKGYVDTPFGSGSSTNTASGSDGFTALPSFHTACRLQTACLAVAIIAM